MTIALNATALPESQRYEQLAQIFRPTFQEIGNAATQRDAGRILPYDAVGQLAALKFGTLRLSISDGGFGASLSDLFRLFIELSEADSNLVQIFRAHFGFVEDLIFQPRTDWSDRWIARVAAGELVSVGWTEPADASSSGFSTRVSLDGDRWRLDGRKFYTTGALYSQWIDVGATNSEGERVSVVVSTTAPGLQIIDDWNGFGQALTGSGTAIFDNVGIGAVEIRPTVGRIPSQTAFFQVVHLATLAGIGNAVAAAAADYIRKRKRTYSHASAPLARNDPQVLQLIGRVQAGAYAATMLTLDVARKLDRADELLRKGLHPDVAALDIAVYQAQIVISEKVLEATTTIFNGLGASALSTDLRLDRYWRNARTISSHNPVIYKERIIGDYIVNGTAPPLGWLAGVS